MRPRGSLIGPLLLIIIGLLFLLRAFSPNFHVWHLFELYWPYLLILWGALAFIEVTVRFFGGAAMPVNGISGGGWFLVIIICAIGFTSFEVSRHSFWPHFNWQHEFAAFGEDHEYSITPQQTSIGFAPHIVIERFRGDARITAGTGPQLSVSGHKSIRTFDDSDARKANGVTPVQIVTQSPDTWIIRCNQDRADSHMQVSDYLDITVPKGASVEATGIYGDFDITGIDGNVDLSSENAGVRLQDLAGNVVVDTRRSDIIRCVNVNGTVDLRGHGDDVELSKVAGQVTIKGDYSGAISLHELAKPVRVSDMRTQLELQQVPGEVRLERGDVSLQNVVGPLKLTTHDTDVTLDGVSSEVNMTVDKGDIQIRPGHLPLAKMTIRTQSGDIEIALPQSAGFALDANTDRGEINNEFGDSLRQQTQGRGARLQGSTGNGPDVVLNTGRGSITVRKANVESVSAAKVM